MHHSDLHTPWGHGKLVGELGCHIGHWVGGGRLSLYKVVGRAQGVNILWAYIDGWALVFLGLVNSQQEMGLVLGCAVQGRDGWQPRPGRGTT